MHEQVEAVEAGHDQILQDHRRLDLLRQAQGLLRVGAEVEVDVALCAQRPSHGLADHGLIVDQQHHHLLLVLSVLVRGTPLGPLHYLSPPICE